MKIFQEIQKNRINFLKSTIGMSYVILFNKSAKRAQRFYDR